MMQLLAARKLYASVYSTFKGDVSKFFRSCIQLLIPLLCLAFALQTASAANYAFLVGVTDYSKGKLSPLKYTERDVTELANTLVKSGFRKQNIVLMTKAEGLQDGRFSPVSTAIRSQLAGLLPRLKADDTLILVFSGHGVQFQGDKTINFCPMDAVLDDQKTLLSLSEIYTTLDRRCKARIKLLLVDACRKDPRPAGAKPVDPIKINPPSIGQPPKPPSSLVAFFSCSNGELSFEHEELKHGLFMHSVIKSFQGYADINGDRELSLTELQNYCTRETNRLARRYHGIVQTPELHSILREPVLHWTVPTPLPVGLTTNLNGLQPGQIPRNWQTNGPIGLQRFQNRSFLGRLGGGVLQQTEWIQTPEIRIHGDFELTTQVFAPDGGVFDFKLVDHNGDSTVIHLQCGRRRAGNLRSWLVTTEGNVRVPVMLQMGSAKLKVERTGQRLRVAINNNLVSSFQPKNLGTIANIELGMIAARDPAGLETLRIVPTVRKAP